MDRVPLKTLLIIAVWAGWISGFLEGLIYVLTRPYPFHHAAHKVSPDILWVSPLVDVILFAALALGLAVVLGFVTRVAKQEKLRAAHAAFVFAGVLFVAKTLDILHAWAAVVLALGVSVVAWRGLRRPVERWTALLSRFVWCVPVAIVVTVIATSAYGAWQEWQFVRGLPASPTNAPNVLVIVMDTVRKDRFSPASGQSLTPNLDQLIAEGTRYENAWATSPWSLPSQFSILFGQHLYQFTSEPETLHPGLNLPEFLSQKGYVTGAFSGNSAWVTPEYLGHGFAQFKVYVLEDLLRRTRLGRLFRGPLARAGFAASGRGKKAPQIAAEFLSFVDRYRGRPFFSYLCFMDVNQDMHQSKQNLKEPINKVVEAYDRGLRELDADLGKLMQELKQRGVLDNTILVLTSDHGESFGAVAGDHDPPGHATSLYPEQAAVPLFLVFPSKVRSGVTVAQTVSLAQIPSTVVGLLGNSPPTSWAEAMPVEPLPEVSEDQRVLFMNLQSSDELEASAVGQVQGPWLYIRQLRDKGKLKAGEVLFNLSADPQAKVDLVQRQETLPRLQVMRQRMDSWLARWRGVRSQVGNNR